MSKSVACDVGSATFGGRRSRALHADAQPRGFSILQTSASGGSQSLRIVLVIQPSLGCAGRPHDFAVLRARALALDLALIGSARWRADGVWS